MKTETLENHAVVAPSAQVEFAELWRTVFPDRKRRKEPRFPFCYQIQVRGLNVANDPFEEHTNTADISKSGCRFSLLAHVPRGAFLALSVQGEDGRLRPETAIYSVVWCRPQGHDSYEVGAELVDGPNLWHIDFPDARIGSW